ncbi:MAG: short chain dehydrogenase [Hyphomonadaceae bacterium]|nr:short chain dehydrogenase [Hyphomonadaceae bacterium]OUX94470.1 MAG: short chain dehydrogenase [Hyphomonas sp. TMED17]
MSHSQRLLDGPKRALVTGAGLRLGRAMALDLGRQGWSVAIHCRQSRSAAMETADLIRQQGGEAAIVQADLSDHAQTASLCDMAQTVLGGALTLLVNSASTFTDDSALDHTQADWDHHMGPNLRAPILLAQSFAQRLPASDAGLIINMIDMRVLKPNPLFFTYTVSKAALWFATRTLAQALAPNIRVNAIGPGPTLENVHQKPGEFAAETKATLTQAGSNPDEIVKAMNYLTDADSVTGQMIASDGGQHLMWQTPDVML